MEDQNYGRAYAKPDIGTINRLVVPERPKEEQPIHRAQETNLL